jgi:hypothetical protein
VNDYVLWTGKYVGAAILVVIAAILIYLFGVLNVYVIAWIVELIGFIFN